MGQGNAAVKQWMSNPGRFADLFNGVVFQGKQVVLAEDLEQSDSEANVLDSEKEGKVKEIRRHRDIVMRWKKGVELVILACENQENVHYAMPVRAMLYDSLSYTEQIQRLWDNVPKDEKISNEEFLSKFRKNDKLHPVITIVLYYGKEKWDGNIELYDMFEENLAQNSMIRNYIQNYRINLIDVAHTENIENFRTDLQVVLGMLKYRGQKKELVEYLNTRPEYFKHVDRDTYDVIRTFLRSEQFMKKKIEMDKEEIDMCQALQDLYDEGIEKGIEQTLIDNVENIMKNLKVSAERACEIISVPFEKYQKVKTSDK